jgi:endonuclease-3 related protein
MKRSGCTISSSKVVPDTGNPCSPTLEAICVRLIEAYTVENWWPADSQFEVLVGAILVQNTRWVNVEKAIDRLREHQCLDPLSLSHMKHADLQDRIRPAGCQSVKARRLHSLAVWVVESGGLETLKLMSTPNLRSALLKVHGIGAETADAILCFGFSRQVFVADLYARTWLSRTGLVPDSAARRYASCHEIVEPTLAKTKICMQDLHAAIVVHAQSVCRREPECHRCVLTKMCTFAFGTAVARDVRC